MKVFGKNIRLYLLDGIPQGRWICELSNWTGKAYKIPRNYYKECESRSELHTSGIYFLFGHDDADKSAVYIGETEDILERLKSHVQSKDFWNEAIIFISKDDHLNKAHIKFLENEFFSIAKENKRYVIMNENTPKKSAVSEAEEAELEEFIYNAKILVATLGHKVFEPIIQNKLGDKTNEEDIFYIKNNKGLLAKGILTSDGFVVLKGSSINSNPSNKSLTAGAIKVREKYIAEGVVKDFELTEDILFSSSSTAAGFVCGYSVSGPQHWKNAEGKSLKELSTEL